MPDRPDHSSQRTWYSSLRPLGTGEPSSESAEIVSLAETEAGFTLARQRDMRDREECVDLYYRAAMQAWRLLGFDSLESAADARDYDATFALYHQSLAGLITAGARFGRLDPRGRLLLAGPYGWRTVAISYHGFAWQPAEFCEVHLARDFRSRDILHEYRARGLGVALVAVRHACREEAFHRPHQSFPVTAVLRPARSPGSSGVGSVATTVGTASAGAQLEFYNPLRIESLGIGCGTIPLDRDLTAPLAYHMRQTPRMYLEGFLDPGRTDVKPQLVFMEPYQPGKIPVVFIHGLGSDLGG